MVHVQLVPLGPVSSTPVPAVSQDSDSTLTPTTHFNLLKSFHLSIRGSLSTTTTSRLSESESPCLITYVTGFIPTALPYARSHGPSVLPAQKPRRLEPWTIAYDIACSPRPARRRDNPTKRRHGGLA